MSPGHHELGAFIRQHREAAGLSMSGLAERARVNRSTIMRWEEGARTPGAAELAKLARALDVDFEDLFALAGYVSPLGLPTVAPYLRTKYGLSGDALAEAERMFAELIEREGGGDAEPAD